MCVPTPAGSPMPRANINKDAKARILSVYFRPWTLNRQHATETVPYLGHLDRIYEVRISGKKQSDRHPIGYRTAWKHYVRGNVVSHHAERIIRNFLSTMTAYAGTEDCAEEEEIVANAEGHQLRRGNDLNLSVENVHSILQNMGQRSTLEEICLHGSFSSW